LKNRVTKIHSTLFVFPYLLIHKFLFFSYKLCNLEVVFKLLDYMFWKVVIVKELDTSLWQNCNEWLIFEVTFRQNWYVHWFPDMMKYNSIVDELVEGHCSETFLMDKVQKIFHYLY